MRPLPRKIGRNFLASKKKVPLAAQAHFGLAALYRKQGKTAAAQQEMQEFQKLQGSTTPGQPPAKAVIGDSVKSHFSIEQSELKFDFLFG